MKIKTCVCGHRDENHYGKNGRCKNKHCGCVLWRPKPWRPKPKAVANGMPLPTGRAIASAVKAALETIEQRTA